MLFEINGWLIYYYGTLICFPAFCTCLYCYYCNDEQDSLTYLYKHRYLIFIWLFFIAFLIIASLYKTGSNVPEDMKAVHRFCHGAFSVISAVSSLEFLMAWFTDTDKLLKENQKVDSEKIEVGEVVYENMPKIECKVCFLSYSNIQNIPRILKECGHTICENCANQLLSRHNREYLMCPFCQMITVVNGAANSLKKNQAALDFVEDLKKQS
ncbi:unnamed protein product [Caenorhabditis brenneri]